MHELKKLTYHLFIGLLKVFRIVEQSQLIVLVAVDQLLENFAFNHAKPCNINGTQLK